MNTTCRAQSFLRALGLSVFVCLTSAALGLSATSTTAVQQHVDLELTLQPNAGGVIDQEWAVQLRMASGEWLRIATARVGEKVHFKHLAPDIYVACLQGIHSPEQCQSIDMFVPKDGKDHSFKAKLAVPEAVPNSPDFNRVSLQELEIPEKARKEFLRALKASTQGDEQGEIDHLQRAINVAPFYVEALNNLGAHYHRTGNDKLSLQCLTKATEVNSDFYAGWANLAAVLLSTGQREKALKAAMHALALRPEDPYGNSQVALSFYYMDRYAEAGQYFKKVMKLDPSFSISPMPYLAWIALIDNRKDEAADYLRLFLKLHPNAPDASSWSDLLYSLTSGDTSEPPTITAQQRQN